MKMPGSHPTFSDVHISAKVDFVKLFSPNLNGIKRIKGKLQIGRDFRNGRTGYRITIHDLLPSDLELYKDQLHDAEIIELEIAIDFKPRSSLTKAEFDRELELWRVWLIMHVYPWDAHGIQKAHRLTRAKNSKDKTPVTEATFGGINHQERLPDYNQTFYLGHRDDKWADPRIPNSAHMKIYGKRFDQNDDLTFKKWSARIEVTLKENSCQLLSLKHLNDLKGFNFRKALSGYFRMIDIDKVALPPAKTTHPLIGIMRSFSEKFLRHVITNVGAYALKYRKIVTYRDSDTIANERIGDALANLGKQFKTGT